MCADIVSNGAKVELIAILPPNSSITPEKPFVIPEPCRSSTVRASLSSGACSNDSSSSSSGGFACMDSSRLTVSDASAINLARPLPKRSQPSQLYNQGGKDSSAPSHKQAKKGGNAGGRRVTAEYNGTSNLNNLEAQNSNAKDSGACSQGETCAKTDTVIIKVQDDRGQTQKDIGTDCHGIVQHDRQSVHKNGATASSGDFTSMDVSERKVCWADKIIWQSSLSRCLPILLGLTVILC